MKMQIQYPSIEGNQLYDGEAHTIKPSSLHKFENQELYLLKYFDETF